MSIGKFLLGNEKLKLIFKKIAGKFNFIRKVKINGKKYLIPIINNVGFNNLITDDGHWMVNLLDKLIKNNNSTIIDVGANVGQTLLDIKSVKPDIRYIGIEPNPTCVSYIRQLIKTNKILNSQILPVGLYSETKLISLFLNGNVDAGATIIENLSPGSPAENFIVPVFGFDSLIKDLNINNIELIKIDTEGAELDIIKSVAPYLKSIKPLIICEVLWANNENSIENVKNRNNELFNILDSNDYEVYQIVKSKDLNHITEYKKIYAFESKIYTFENRNLCDYIFIHKEKFELLNELKSN